MRVAWFSPLPPDASGIAAYTAEVAARLAPRLRALDLYCPPATTLPRDGRLSPDDFVWRQRRDPYDLIVYQLGNSPAHDFMWGYLFHYPGMVVLHDAQLHQARALGLLRRAEPRLDDYLAELEANHPGSAELGHLVAAGLGGSLFRLWPLVSLVIRASRLTVVHNARLAQTLSDSHPDASITAIEMGVADPLATVPDRLAARAWVRARHGIPAEAFVLGAYGGVTPEKRIPQLLAAVAGPLRRHPLHVLLVGQRVDHYEVDASVRRLGLTGRIHITGYVPDQQLPAYLAAADASWCLRWPSNGETSASWLRCLGAGQPTLVTALAQWRDVPTLSAAGASAAPADTPAVGVALDPVDEAGEIPVAVSALIDSPALCRRLGSQARAWWAAHHTLAGMADAYDTTMRAAMARPAPAIDLPAHLRDDGTGTARRLLAEMGLPGLAW